MRPRTSFVVYTGGTFDLLHAGHVDFLRQCYIAAGHPYGHTALWRQLRHLCQKAGLRRIGWHVLRHTFASSLAMKGVPLPAVQALLGHSTITMTMRYTHVAPSALRSAIDLLSQVGSSRQPVGNQTLQIAA